jgi:hypothetical protein
MSDNLPPPYLPPNPYGGQAPLGSSYPQQPVPAPYGQPAFGQPGYGRGANPDRRPGTVTAAGIITLVLSGIVLVVAALMAVGLVLVKDDVVKEIRKEPRFDDVGNANDLVAVLLVLVVVLAIWCVAAMVLAVLAMRRSNVARVLLVISSVMAALISLLLITSLVSFITLAAAVTTVVLLFVGGSSDWFARRG